MSNETARKRSHDPEYPAAMVNHLAQNNPFFKGEYTSKRYQTNQPSHHRRRLHVANQRHAVVSKKKKKPTPRRHHPQTRRRLPVSPGFSSLKFGRCRSHSPLVVCLPSLFPPTRATLLCTPSRLRWSLEHGFGPDVVVGVAAVAVGPRRGERVGSGRAIGREGRRVPAPRRPLVPGALFLPLLAGAGAADRRRCGI